MINNSENVERKKALSTWLSEVTVSGKPSSERGIFLNEIIFTHRNGNRLCLTLFDVKELDEESLYGEYYLAAGDTMAELPAGFPMLNSIIYTKAAAAISNKQQ